MQIKNISLVSCCKSHPTAKTHYWTKTPVPAGTLCISPWQQTIKLLLTEAGKDFRDTDDAWKCLQEMRFFRVILRSQNQNQ